MNQRPIASLSLDLDDLWCYQKIHGDPGWQDFPSYLCRLVQLLRERLRHHGLRITVFVVGQDAALARNAEALASLAADGHEIGNHSFSHEPWFHTYRRDEIVAEIAKAEEHIERVTGQRPRGFRGPGFSLSQSTLQVLAERGYQYDASTFPTFLGPLARAYYFWNSRGLTPEQREQRKRLFGTASEGLRPLRPYLWDLPEAAGPIVEIPVSTMPGLRLPFHMSYIGYLASFSRSVARLYLRTALDLCRATHIAPSFLLHPLDLLGGDEVPQLLFFPGMRLSTPKKLELFDDLLGLVLERFTAVSMAEHAAAARAQGKLAHRTFK